MLNGVPYARKIFVHVFILASSTDVKRCKLDMFSPLLFLFYLFMILLTYKYIYLSYLVLVLGSTNCFVVLFEMANKTSFFFVIQKRTRNRKIKEEFMYSLDVYSEFMARN